MGNLATAAPESAMSTYPEYMRFFDEAYARVYAPWLEDAEMARDEARRMAQLLAVPPGGAVLDVGCGTGRHVLALAEQGLRGTGLDLSRSLLQSAARSAEESGLHDIRWIHQDMRSLPFVEEFDGVISVFSSFGYFEHEEEDAQVLKGVWRALKPGGMCILDTRTLYSEFSPGPNFSRPPSERSPRQICSRLQNGLVVLEETTIHPLTNRRTSLITVFEPEQPRSEYLLSMRLYTPLELIRLCESSRLHVEACFGGFDRRGYTMDGRLVLLCRKIVPREGEGGSPEWNA
jgi:ubiquinone/menaquinone biosynthesis C-methylase UbiE